ncbi:MAG: hypothetical protein ABIK89_21535 [Planctomycetota bacterium]
MTVSPNWSDVRDSLTAAIRTALPLQLDEAKGDRVAGLGVHMDACHGSAGLYLLPESALRTMNPSYVDNIGDWPISTDWNPDDDHSQAFASHWGKWDDWFHENLDEFDKHGGDEWFRRLLLVACEAVREVESSGLLDFPKTEDFRIIIAEHDEPDELALERYSIFIETGNIRCHGDPT